MKTNIILVSFLAICFAWILLSATTLEAGHCRQPRVQVNFNVIPPAPRVQPVAYYATPVYPVYYAPMPYVVQPAPVVYYPPQRIYAPQSHASFSFGWYR